MAEIKTFLLPDLAEGLPDAEIIEWHVAEGDSILLDAPLVAMETAKAVVEVPSPFSGRVLRLHGKAGSVINTGAALVDIELDPNQPQRADAQDTGHSQTTAPTPTPEADINDKNCRVVPNQHTELPDSENQLEQADQGTVVGSMQAGNEVRSDSISSLGGVKVMPAVRAFAKKLGVDLRRIRASSADGVISMQDVKAAAANIAIAGAVEQPQPDNPTGTGMTAALPNRGQPEVLHGVRRNMARIMASAHAMVAPATLCDDADIHRWTPANDITVRLVRAIVRSSKAIPALNAWFDMETNTRTLHTRVDIGIAVDTEDGLFAPVLRNADSLDAASIRAGVDLLRKQVKERSIAAEELKGYTISLSNFGMFAGRYATPVVVPPCVSIIAAGKSRDQLVPVLGGIETHRIIPLSLTFDHRVVTGGEAARFLKVLLDDLALPS